MKNSFPERIPYDIFSKKCLDMGIPMHDIEAMVQENRGMFLITVGKNNDYGNILIILIYHCLKKIYQDKSVSQYYGICLERGLTVNDIRFAESTTEIVIPDIGEDIDTVACRILRQLKKDYSHYFIRLKRNIQILYPYRSSCTGGTGKEFSYRRRPADQSVYCYLLSSFNDHRMTKKRAMPQPG